MKRRLHVQVCSTRAEADFLGIRRKMLRPAHMEREETLRTKSY